MGRREPARLRRVPARVVAEPADLRRHARAAGARRAAADVGRRPPQLHLALPRAAARERDGGAARRVSCRACPRPCATQILARAEGVPLYAVETVRMLLDRGLLVAGGRGLPPDRGDRRARGAGDAPRADRRAARRPLGRRSGGCSRTAPCSARRSRATAWRRSRASRADELEPLLASLVRKEVLASRPTRARPSTASTASCRTSSATSPTRRSRSTSGARVTSPPPSTSSARSPDEDEIAEVVAAHYLDAYEADPEADDAADVGRRRARRSSAPASGPSRSPPQGRRSATSSRLRRLTDEPGERAELLERAGWLGYDAADLDGAASLLARVDRALRG